jgi:hypothetical protein
MKEQNNNNDKSYDSFDSNQVVLGMMRCDVTPRWYFDSFIFTTTSMHDETHG